MGRLDTLALLLKEIKHVVIVFVEEMPCDGTQIRENISGACSLLSALISRAKLSNGQQKVDVVGTNEVLGQRYDCGLKGYLTMMIR